MTLPSYVLTFSCADRPGIVAAVSTALYQLGCNISDAEQFNDPRSERFFARIVFEPQRQQLDADDLRAGLAPVAKSFDAAWSLRPSSARPRVLIMVSRLDHCLVDLLYRWHTGELAMDVVGIVANHPPETYAHLELFGIPLHYLPVTPETKPGQEEQVWELVSEQNVDLVVLARYMQILSDDLARKLAGHCINIHHSFLPGFAGAKPHHQAYERGVKLIGATAHYVTSELDEGPIIAQDVEPVTHRDTPDDLARKGRDIERRVLAGAVRHHVADRVLINGRTTIVFAE